MSWTTDVAEIAPRTPLWVGRCGCCESVDEWPSQLALALRPFRC